MIRSVPAGAAPGGDATVDAVFRTLFLAYPDALVVADGSGRIVLANPSAATLLGYEVDELFGLEIDVLVPDAVRARHAAYRQAFNDDPRARPMGKQTELVARRKDGSEVVVEIALSPLQDHDHPLVVAAIRDIGSYPRMKQALQRARYSEQLARVGRLAVDAREPQKLLDEIPLVAAEALEVDLAIVYLLQPDRLELRVAGVVGKTIPGEAIGDRIANRPDTSLGRVLAEGSSLTVTDYASERRFEVPRAYLDAGLTSALAVPLSDLGRIIGVLVVRSRRQRDFAADEIRFLESLANMLASSLQRVHSEEALNHAQRLESVGQLTGGIAHDFNNLLTVIQGNLQVLGDLPSLAGDSYGGQLLGAASRAARRGAELTSKLLAFSRRQVLQPSAVDADAMLHSLADMLRRTLDQRIRIEVASEPGMSVMADPGQLESALLNIAINARDAMPTGGTLRFRAGVCTELPDSVVAEVGPAPSGFVAIAISDTGSGMSAETRERAFEPFFTTKEVGRGTGLGLSTVYGFVKQSKGAITLDSVVDHGTTVTLYIPRPGAPAAVGGDSGTTGVVPAGLAVLLVEDDPEVRAVMRRFLDSLRSTVLEASSGEQALLALGGDDRFDVLLTDIALGAGMRGTELAAKAQERFPALAIVLMSGFPAELIEADRDSPLGWELLRKPCSREELTQAIARVVRAF
jgi:PAS domain S-box-containing protein